MTVDLFFEEFQALSRLSNSLLDEAAYEAEFIATIKRLRREADGFQVLDNDREAQNISAGESSNSERYKLLEELLRQIGQQLTTLFRFVDYGGSLESALEVESSLHQLKTFANAMWIISKAQSSPNNQFNLTTHVRSIHILTECTSFIKHLGCLFGTYYQFLQSRGLQDASHSTSVNTRSSLRSLIKLVPEMVAKSISTFERSELKIMQTEWMNLLHFIERLLVRAVMKLKNLPKMSNLKIKTMVIGQMEAFILLLKLSRLFIHKICKYTSQRPYIGSRMELKEMREWSRELRQMASSLRHLCQVVDTIDPSPNNDVMTTTKDNFRDSVGLICRSLKQHLRALSSNNRCDDLFISGVIDWITRWDFSTSLALSSCFK